MIADIDEDWATPVDTRMEQLGGVVFRRIRSVVTDTQDDRNAAAHRAEMDQLKAERQQARADRLAKSTPGSITCLQSWKPLSSVSASRCNLASNNGTPRSRPCKRRPLRQKGNPPAPGGSNRRTPVRLCREGGRWTSSSGCGAAMTAYITTDARAFAHSPWQQTR